MQRPHDTHHSLQVLEDSSAKELKAGSKEEIAFKLQDTAGSTGSAVGTTQDVFPGKDDGDSNASKSEAAAAKKERRRGRRRTEEERSRGGEESRLGVSRSLSKNRRLWPSGSRGTTVRQTHTFDGDVLGNSSSISSASLGGDRSRLGGSSSNLIKMRLAEDAKHWKGAAATSNSNETTDDLDLPTGAIHQRRSGTGTRRRRKRTKSFDGQEPKDGDVHPSSSKEGGFDRSLSM